MFRLDGKVAIITGSTSGIGLAIARMFQHAGASVVVSAADEAETQDVARDLGATGIACDVRREADLHDLIRQTIATLGGIDILVLNAGITDHGPAGGVADFDAVMAINLRSQVALCNLALPHLAERGGNLVFIASIAGLRGNAHIHAYALAKAGVAQLARNIAVQWGPRGVRANAISPGLIRTRLVAALPQEGDFMARRLQMTPLRRMGEVEEVAAAALFLASAAGGFVNGHDLVVDGGTLITDGN